MSFRDNLQHLRASRNMTQEQLAMLVGVSRQSVTKWEAERAYPEMDKLLKLCQIFGCTLDDLVSGDLTASDAPGSQDSAPRVPSGPPTDVCGYDEYARRFAMRLSTGIALIILALAAGEFASWALGGSAAESALPGIAGNDGISAIPLLVLVAAGVALIVPAGLERSNFQREHPYIEDFYTNDDRARARNLFTRSLVTGIVIAILGILPVSVVEEGPLEDVAGVTLLALWAIAAWLILYGSLMWSRVNVARYNQKSIARIGESELDDANLPAAEKERRAAWLKSPRAARARTAGRVSGIIMLSATAIALIWLFMGLALGMPGKLGNFFWVPWPIGGICCAIAATVIDGRED